MILQTKWQLDTPALCLDLDLLEANVQRMAAFLADKPAALRPHTKTHKCPTIAWMQIHAGAIGVTCAKVGEAEVMARAGIRDILIANQVVGEDKIARLMGLAAYSDVMVAIEDLANARALSEAAAARGIALRVLLEVDVGMGRCGVAPGQATLDLAREVCALPGLRFEGLMGYEGHAVMIPDMAERTAAAHRAMGLLVGSRDLLVENGIEVAIVSGGGTGTYAITGAYEGLTEIQAGSYATMDAKYRSVGLDFAQALTVVARVISARDDTAIIDAGMKTLTHEFGLPEVVQPTGWRLKGLSEEHGSLIREGGEPLKPGDRVEIVPSHGCTTINLHDVYHVTRGERYEGLWPIAARGAIR
ncbi:MAG: DSD1 family PLP-dependent enzyme [Chloroflexi bacterium]|nr:DSD1 family PLP-dependent enzyme [Chloroflexota bacterium]